MRELVVAFCRGLLGLQGFWRDPVTQDYQLNPVREHQQLWLWLAAGTPPWQAPAP